ncbi:dimethylargininase [Streptomyces sp. CB03911]|uniref:dimethylargininase n=1 Tax=Streptomyces sp. CB03911 TaxID=1804758 RepID=UPI00093EAC68|nr:dimethylargininase [Streptomyces sp. CB03911]OKI25624.1 amidinotransferase [Streptomyces sp. CB03911]
MGRTTISAVRTASSRRFLMCRPTYFAVEYAINPWMDPSRPVDPLLVVEQWEALRGALLELGHAVDLIDPVPGLPDMVFAANGATVLDGRALVATFRHPQRAPESGAYEKWLRDRGHVEVRCAEHPNEGEGDHLVVAGVVLAGHGFRTAAASHAETADYLGRPVIGLTLVDPRFYHLDTALAVLDEEQIMYWPGAFSPASRRRLHSLFPHALRVEEQDAVHFGLNAISDGRHVLLPTPACSLAGRLASEGYEPIALDVSELAKAGGGPKCCVLQLRQPEPPARP